MESTTEQTTINRIFGNPNKGEKLIYEKLIEEDENIDQLNSKELVEI